MIPASVKSQLVTCPFCGRGGFTRTGLSYHWCAAAPKLGGQETKSRPLTMGELRTAREGTAKVGSREDSLTKEVSS